jgi:hypothetical protein
MAEVFKFNDLKEEGSEAAVKVIFILHFILLDLMLNTFLWDSGSRKISSTR